MKLMKASAEGVSRTTYDLRPTTYDHERSE
jgi:hypothetical protein